MGLDAELLLLGPFSEEVKSFLDYPPEYYDDTNDDTVVTRSMFSCVTTDQSYELAEIVGCEAWNFNTHIVRKENVDIPALTEFVERNADSVFKDIKTFMFLLDKGFTCIYMPNG